VVETEEKSLEQEKDLEENPYVAKFLSFFEAHYKKDIERLVGEYPQKKSLDVDFKELEKFDYELADELIDNPDYLLEAAELAIQSVEVPALELEEFKPHVRLFNIPKDREILVRDIGSEYLNKLISVEGVIRQITDALPKLKLATWQCKRCGNTYKTPQETQELKQPAFCECRHRDFLLVQDQSEFVDYQKVQIQEPLEKLRGNEQASYLDVYLGDDLVHRINAGDKVRFVGVLRLYPAQAKKIVFGRFLETMHVEETELEFEEVEINPEEEKEIKKLASDPKIYDLLTASIAPAIYGHEAVKESIVLQLFGGVKKILPGNQVIRGNAHILLVGDPGTGKSQLLQATHNIAPKSIYTAGRTTSGVGLCVAPDSLILNNQGFKRIDDFVEENFDERKAIEEIPSAWANNFDGKSPCLGNELQVNSGKIYKIWKIKAPEEMFRIKTRFGKEIELTPNTSLVRIKCNKVEWIKALDIKKGDFIACPRKLPEGKRQRIPTIELLCKDKNIRVKDNVAWLVKKITDKLVGKYGSLQEIAKRMGKSRDTLYAIRNEKFYHGISLKNLVELGKEAGYGLEQLSEHVKEIFISHGKDMLIPRYVDDMEIAYLAGVVLGDGSLDERKDKSSNIRVFSASEKFLKGIDKIVLDKFGLKTEKINDGKRIPARRIKYKVFCEILKAFGLSKRKNKIKISHLASEMPNSVLAKLLQGLFDTDGWIYLGGSSHIGLITISKELAKTLQLSLLKFGIHSNMRKRKKAGKIAIGKKITVRSRHDQYCVELRGKRNIDLFNRHIGFNLMEKKAKLKKLAAKEIKANTNVDIIPEVHQVLKKQNAEWIYASGRSNISREKLQSLISKKDIKSGALEKLAESDIIWEKVSENVSFKPNYNFVYDFSVEKSHNFIANGIFVHNTASAVKDDFGEGGWTLKAGALVLSSGGTCMADELDKMAPEDRVALHEAMEQGMVSVAKAGIVTRFKADTSILAAANPKFSRFDPYQPFIEQVQLPSTLISRFDLFFMIRDVLDRTKDEQISEHILKTHKSGETLRQYKKKGKKLNKQEQEQIDEIATPPIDADTMRKYISYARQNVFPTLSEEAISAIREFYLQLRDMGRNEGSYAATHRQLEGLVRLSEASARVRLSDVVEPQDSERAIKLVRACLQDLVTDPETGKIDYDIIATGQTHTQITNMKKILGIVKGKAADMDMVPLQDVLAEAKESGIAEDRARDIIDKLEKKGELYKPRHNFLKPTQRGK